MPARATTLVVATTNPGKLREIEPMLRGAPVELTTLTAFPPIEPPDENGRTFADNARLKALYYAERTGELTMAEDSGLEIDALDGAPGVESARYGGADASYPEKFSLIYRALAAKGAESRSARFVCAVALVKDGRVIFETRGVVEGTIAPEPRGTGGFGYDPIFFYPPFGCTLAEAGNRKAAVSHRAAAMKNVKEFLLRSA